MTLIKIGSLEFSLDRRPIKNLRISVLPPVGEIEVIAPESMTNNAIRLAVVDRIPWIRKQQKLFAKQARQSQREMVQGESHYLWGRAYRLDVVERHGKHEVVPNATRLRLYVRASTTAKNKQRVLDDFYRTQLIQKAAPLFARWQAVLGVDPSHWGVRRMKTKWGSCNTEAQRILLNLELAKKPVNCLEYIVLHELLHLIERHHNHRFAALLDKHMPDWRIRRAVLNEMPLEAGGSDEAEC